MTDDGILAMELARQQKETTLRSGSLFSDRLIESMPGVLYVFDMSGRFLRWSRNLEMVSGYSTDEVSQMHPLDFFAPKDKPLLERKIVEAFEKGESSVEAEFITKDGTAKPYFLSGRTIEFNKMPCLVGIGVDISELRKVQDRVVESERKYRELVENANSIILRWSLQGQVIMLNEFGQRFFGFTAEEIIGRHVMDTIVPSTENSGRDLQQLMEKICADPMAFAQNINENKRRNGERVWISWTNRVVRDPQGQAMEILSIGTDVTARKRAEEARQQSDARYRTLFEYAPEGIVISNSKGFYLDANESICRMLGYSRDEMIGLHASNILAPEEILNIDPALSALQAKIDIHREWRFRRKDGSEFAAEVIATAMPDGNLMRMIRDITDRKRAEIEQEKRYRAEASDRIKSAFLATMSHELRTPLNSIIGFTGIMLQQLAGPLNPEQNKQLDLVRVSARHLLALVNDVLDISKIEAGQLDVARQPFDINSSINKVIAIIAPQAKAKRLELRVKVASALGEAVSDERRFEQILLNLLSNALKFTERGEVTLEAELLPESVIRLRVSDTGMGIKPEEMPKLFQPFHQIDSGISRKHEGTGLGLAICQRLATLMGGAISAESEWQKGSTFIVTLPLKGQVKS